MQNSPAVQLFCMCVVPATNQYPTQ